MGVKDARVIIFLLIGLASNPVSRYLRGFLWRILL